jgi:hypothetical protein
VGDTVIGLLHPGEMGAAVAGCLTARVHQVLWAPPGRSAATAARATAAGLSAAASVAELTARAGLILSICPPHAALDARVIGTGPGSAAASALKMAYAGWTKGAAALLLAVRALARAEGVEDALLAEWALSQPDLAGRSAGAAQSAAAKGWRWTGEMTEIAASMAAAGLPDGFHQAAADIFRRSGPG